MTELGESDSQRNYMLVLVKDDGSSCNDGNRRVDAFTSKERAGKGNKPLHPTLLPTTCCFLSPKNSELCPYGGLEGLLPSKASHSPTQLSPKLPETLLLPTGCGLNFPADATCGI